jgi:hypothetical protein
MGGNDTTTLRRIRVRQCREPPHMTRRVRRVYPPALPPCNQIATEPHRSATLSPTAAPAVNVLTRRDGRAPAEPIGRRRSPKTGRYEAVEPLRRPERRPKWPTSPSSASTVGHPTGLLDHSAGCNVPPAAASCRAGQFTSAGPMQAAATEPHMRVTLSPTAAPAATLLTRRVGAFSRRAYQVVAPPPTASCCRTYPPARPHAGRLPRSLAGGHPQSDTWPTVADLPTGRGGVCPPKYQPVAQTRPCRLHHAASTLPHAGRSPRIHSSSAFAERKPS